MRREFVRAVVRAARRGEARARRTRGRGGWLCWMNFGTRGLTTRARESR